MTHPDMTKIRSRVDIVYDTNVRELIGNKTGAIPSDLWGFCIGDVFVPVQITTKLHVLFQSGEFSGLRLFHELFTRGPQSHMWQRIEALLQTPGKRCSMFPPHYTFPNSLVTAIQEWCSLLEMGFIPLCTASKLGELERRGACSYPVIGVVVSPPFFDSTPKFAPPEHFCSMFGLSKVFTGCSVVGRAVRSREWTTVVAFRNRLDFIVHAKLVFMVQCYPLHLEGMPIGTRLGTRTLRRSDAQTLRRSDAQTLRRSFRLRLSSVYFANCMMHFLTPVDVQLQCSENCSELMASGRSLNYFVTLCQVIKYTKDNRTNGASVLQIFQTQVLSLKMRKLN
jgi:hypothetical protein